MCKVGWVAGPLQRPGLHLQRCMRGAACMGLQAPCMGLQWPRMGAVLAFNAILSKGQGATGWRPPGQGSRVLRCWDAHCSTRRSSRPRAHPALPPARHALLPDLLGHLPHSGHSCRTSCAVDPGLFWTKPAKRHPGQPAARHPAAPNQSCSGSQHTRNTTWPRRPLTFTAAAATNPIFASYPAALGRSWPRLTTATRWRPPGFLT